MKRQAKEVEPQYQEREDLKEISAEKTKRGFWEELRESKEYTLYYPNRFEYFVGRALQGLVAGRPEKDLRTVVRRSIDLAIEVENELDSAED